MLYWQREWDWECPTLFGLSLEEFGEVIRAWPEISAAGPGNTALAALGAFRELLYGASSLPPDQIENTIGISFTDAKALYTTISRHHLGHGRAS